MSWNPFASKNVEVVFLDAASGQTIARMSVRPDQLDTLPDTFALATDMTIKGRPWRVERAEPLTKAQYAKSRKLTLWLSPAQPTELVNPADLRYSMPSICDLLPPSDGAPVDGTELVLHEDDWRQLEWVSRTHAALVTRELDAVSAIRREHSAGPGFRQIHVRSLIATPIEPGIPLDKIMGGLGPGLSLRPVRFAGSATRIRNAFAARLAWGAHLYGLAPNNRATVIAVDGGDLAKAASAVSPLTQGATFVSWCGDSDAGKPQA